MAKGAFNTWNGRHGERYTTQLKVEVNFKPESETTSWDHLTDVYIQLQSPGAYSKIVLSIGRENYTLKCLGSKKGDKGAIKNSASVLALCNDESQALAIPPKAVNLAALVYTEIDRTANKKERGI